jgi:hypothetical protein
VLQATYDRFRTDGTWSTFSTDRWPAQARCPGLARPQAQGEPCGLSSMALGVLACWTREGDDQLSAEGLVVGQARAAERSLRAAGRVIGRARRAG